MATISLSQALYGQAQSYAREDNISLEEWAALLIKRFAPTKKKVYKMKKIQR